MCHAVKPPTSVGSRDSSRGKENALEEHTYENPSDKRTAAPATSPIAAFEGDEAADVMSRLMRGEDATAVFGGLV